MKSKNEKKKRRLFLFRNEKKKLHVAHEGHRPTEAIAHQAFRL